MRGWRSSPPARTTTRRPAASPSAARSSPSSTAAGARPGRLLVRLAGGVGGKMSGSVGGAAIPATALDVIEPAIVRWLYVRRLPSQSFAIDLAARDPAPLRRVGPAYGRGRARRADRPRSPCYRESVESSAGPVQPTGARVVPAAVLGGRHHPGQPRADRPDRVRPPRRRGAGSDALLAELEPRLSCAIRYATEVVPEAERTLLRAEFAARRLRASSTRRRAGASRCWPTGWPRLALEGLTTLVYAVPKTVARPARRCRAQRPRSRPPSGPSLRPSTGCSSAPRPVRGCRRCCSRSARTRPGCSSATDRISPVDRSDGARRWRATTPVGRHSDAGAARWTLVATSLGFAVVQLD